MKSFTSKNLHMRPLAEKDQAMFCSLYTDAKTMRFIEPAYSQERAKKTFHNIVNRNSNTASGFNTWAIIKTHADLDSINETSGVKDKRSQQLDAPAIGLIMLYKKAGKYELKVTEVGIMLLRKATGKLLAEEALGAALSYGFSQLQRPHINARYDKRNLATKRITRKVGFNYHKNFADEVLLNSPKNIFNDCNTIIETISRNQWQSHSLQYAIEVEESA